MTAKSSTRTIEHLRARLFDQLDKLADTTNHVTIDLERVRLVNETSRLIIDTARVEVQHAAVIQGAITLPFIEDQEGSAERPYQRRIPAAAAPAPAAAPDPQTPEDAVLNGGPAAGHPWRKPAEGSPWAGLGARVVKATH